MKAKDFVDKFKKVMEQAVDEALNKKEMESLGNAGADLVRKRTRLGSGADKPKGSKQKLKPLSPEYKKQRKRMKKNGELSNNTTPAKSNLTQTGQMLDDLQAIDATKTSVKVGFKDEHAKQKAEWVSEDRPFNNLTKAEVKQLEQELVAKLEKELTKAKNKLK